MINLLNKATSNFPHCEITEPEILNLTADMFTKMGGNSHSYTMHRAQCCFSTSSGNAAEEMALHFVSVSSSTVGSYVAGNDLTVGLAAATTRPAGTISLGTASDSAHTHGAVSSGASAAASNIPHGCKAVVVAELQNASGEPIRYPDGSAVMIGETKAVVRDYIACADLAGDAEIIVSGLNEAAAYKMKVYICVIPKEAVSPISFSVCDTTNAATI